MAAASSGGRVLFPLRALARRVAAKDSVELDAMAREVATQVPRRVTRVGELLRRVAVVGHGAGTGPAFARMAELEDETRSGGVWVPSVANCVSLDTALRAALEDATAELADTLKPRGPGRPPGPPDEVSHVLGRSLAPAWTEVTRLQALLRHVVDCSASPSDNDATGDEDGSGGGRPGSSAAVAAHSLAHAVDDVLVDVEALCNEKHGVVPQVEVVGGDAGVVVCDRGHLRLVLLEVIKNAFAATVARHGIDADEAPPVTIVVGSDPLFPGLQVRDGGAGVPPSALGKCFDFFYSTVPYEAPTLVHFPSHTHTHLPSSLLAPCPPPLSVCTHSPHSLSQPIHVR
jgi:signal transduction histidine kinase